MLDHNQHNPTVARHNGSVTHNGSRPAPDIGSRSATPASPERFGNNGSGRHGQNSGQHGSQHGSQSTASLVSQAATQLSALVRSEMALAKAELARKGKQFGLGGGLLGAAAVLAGFGFALLLTLAVVLLDLVMPLWLAVLTVTAACFLIAGLLAAFGRDKLMAATPAVPSEATSSVRDDLTAVKDAFHDGRHPDDRWYRYDAPSGAGERTTSRYGNVNSSAYGESPGYTGHSGFGREGSAYDDEHQSNNPHYEAPDPESESWLRGGWRGEGWR